MLILVILYSMLLNMRFIICTSRVYFNLFTVCLRVVVAIAFSKKCTSGGLGEVNDMKLGCLDIEYH